jgi:hypothetical protein
MRSFAILSAMLACLISASPAPAQSGNTGETAGNTAPSSPGSGIGAPVAPTVSPFRSGDTAPAALSGPLAETRHEAALPLPPGGTAFLAGRYAAWGALGGGAIGLAYGLSQDDNALGLSPVIEMAIGLGAGFFLGLAVDVVRGLR